MELEREQMIMVKLFISPLDADWPEKILSALRWLNWEQIIQPNAHVFIKPNFTYPSYKEGVTTSPQFLEALVQVLKIRTAKITIGETDGGYYTWKAEEAFANHGLYDLQKRYNIQVMNLYDSEISYLPMTIKNRTYNIPLPKFLLEEVDVFISVPVLKVHAMTKFSFGLKNQWGCVLDPYRMRYHHIFNEAIIKINELLAPKILIADPFYVLTDSGPMTGRAVPFNTMIASDNIFAFDRVGSQILGIDFQDVDHLSYAQQVGAMPALTEIEMNEAVEKFVTNHYKLIPTFKNKIIRRIFKSNWLTYLLYYSRFGIFLHRIYYFLIGKKNEIKNF